MSCGLAPLRRKINGAIKNNATGTTILTTTNTLLICCPISSQYTKLPKHKENPATRCQSNIAQRLAHSGVTDITSWLQDDSIKGINLETLFPT